MNIYVGNLAYGVTDEDLRTAFSAYGEVSRANVIMDRDTGRSKGFGFVEMPDNAQAEAAINGLNDKPLSGRAIRVNEAKPREDRPRRPPRH
jgi:RNA recognition motif-containing protein